MSDSPVTTIDALRERFLRAQLAGDRREALRVIDDGSERGQSPTALRIEIIGAAQREIGRLWQDNEISVAQEHLATAIAQLALAHLYSHEGPRQSADQLVLVACVEGEFHDMGARIAADVLESGGYQVRFLGASVPTAGLVEMARECRPDLVALSAVMPMHRPALRRAVAALRRALGPALPVVVDEAAGADDDEPLDPSTHRAGATAADLLATVRRLLGRSGGAP